MARLNARLSKTLWCRCRSQARRPFFNSPKIKNNTFFLQNIYTIFEASNWDVAPISLLHVHLRRSACYRTIATNNAPLYRSRCTTSLDPFAPALSRVGGEDVLFFYNLYLLGKKGVWCRDGVVLERIPRERAQTTYPEKTVPQWPKFVFYQYDD
jgi:hypothetical protein